MGWQEANRSLSDDHVSDDRSCLILLHANGGYPEAQSVPFNTVNAQRLVANQ